MSTTGERRDATRIELDLAEQWVVHHVMLQQIEAHQENGESPPWWAIDVLETLESDAAHAEDALNDRSFTCYEAWRVRRALSEYAESPDTPQKDVALAIDVIRRVEETFVEPPAALE